ncbi:polysaccharide deacetylase family protein [Afifella marina]|uniref:Chitooligosaccharide deacetylase n=1 Tax=Afifella marina DSM 2698 TaxID=1120955 RepID=A0A1G5NI96_AFIMA|nr:polysaccharide deacetylase family protein [Afifella marina]SCZ37163.1 Polysaccharide deacetylase [Afifella marina DSM 2698]
MSLRHQGIRAALNTLAFTKATRWLPTEPKGSGLVLTLHEVKPEPPAAFAPNAGLVIAPDFLDALLRLLRQADRRIVPLGEMVANQMAGRASPNDVAITLDDGFRNNLEKALPVFRRHRTPFTTFICAGFCDRSAAPWWVALERMIAANSEFGLEGEGPGRMPTSTTAEKYAAFAAWRQALLVDLDGVQHREVMARLYEAHDFDAHALTDELVLDWDGVRLLAEEPLATIGAHTMTHPALARLPADSALAEIKESADRIADETGERPDLLAYPYGFPGAVGGREAALAAQAGMKAAFLTKPGTLRPSADPRFLPRVSLNGYYQDVGLQEILLAPGLWRIAEPLMQAKNALRRGRDVPSTR